MQAHFTCTLFTHTFKSWSWDALACLAELTASKNPNIFISGYFNNFIISYL